MINLNGEAPVQIISHAELEEAIKIFHKYCNPQDMTYEEHLVWENWNDRLDKRRLEEIRTRNTIQG